MQLNSSFSQTPASTQGHMVPLPPAPPSSIPPPPPRVPAIVNTTASRAGQSFGRKGTRVTPSDQSVVSAVTINGQTYNQAVFDINGNQLT